MIGTYAAVAAVCVAALALGQAAICLCGARQWSWFAPPVGLALMCAIAWGTVRLPGNGAISAIAIPMLAVVSLAFLRGRVAGAGPAAVLGAPVALIALAASSLPFIAEGHFGILGTGFNPDMSQHLLAADRLAHGSGSQLLHQGYPLGPHAIVVALNQGLGIGLVEAFSGLTVAVAVLATLTALAIFKDDGPLPRTAAALLVGLPYLVASYFAQGAFKEVMQALFVLAFALTLRESTRPEWEGRSLRFVPAALIAVGTVYTYSFPGLIWLGGILLIWLALGAWSARPVASLADRVAPVMRPAGLAVVVFIVGALPELGRMIDFRSFETFNPAGPGLGNLFGQVSPLEALGIWPSGDFRIAPGDGAAPAAVYYLGAALGTILLAYGLYVCWRRRETAVIAGVIMGLGIYGLARIDGTPYTAAKALEIAAPLVTLAILAPLTGAGLPAGRGRRLPGLAAGTYVVAAAACALLAFANAPVGPASYSPKLTGLRPLIRSGSTLVLAANRLLQDEHGDRYLAWELRGARVCIDSESAAPEALPAGVRFVIAPSGGEGAPFPGLKLRKDRSPYVLWERRQAISGPGPCPLIAVRQARRAPGP